MLALSVWSSGEVSRVGLSKNGASLTGRTVMVTVAVSVRVPSLTRKVKLSVPKKLKRGM